VGLSLLIVCDIEKFTFLCAMEYPIDNHIHVNPDEFRKIPLLLGFDLNTSTFLLHFTPNRSSIVLDVELLALRPAKVSEDYTNPRNDHQWPSKRSRKKWKIPFYKSPQASRIPLFFC
jgi:hypothetical protein